MKKKALKKLNLSRETVAQLDRHLVGGIEIVSFNVICPIGNSDKTCAKCSVTLCNETV